MSLPDTADVGTTLRLLGIVKSRSAAEKTVAELDPSTLGRVAILERKALFSRRQAVESVPLSDPIGKDK